MKEMLHKLFNEQKLIRRAMALWACWLITVVVLRVTEPEALPHVTNAVAMVVSSVIGLLTVVVGLYQRSRQKEENGGA